MFRLVPFDRRCGRRLERHADVLNEAKAIKEAAIQHGQTSLEASAWTTVAQAAHEIANNLTSPELRVELNNERLVSDCGTLLATRTEGGSLLGSDALHCKTELLRVTGNMCYENDENRRQADEAKVPSTILTSLASLLNLDECATELEQAEREWTLPELKFARAAIGALLNMSLTYEPIRKQLLARESIATLLAIVDPKPSRTRKAAVYVVGSWSRGPASGDDEDQWLQRVETGSRIATWAMSIVEELTTEDKASLATAEGVSALASIIIACTDELQSVTYHGWDADEAAERTSIDLELMTNASSLLEAAAIDHEYAKQALGLQQFAEDDGLVLMRLMDFVESAVVPNHWRAETTDGRDGLEKAFSLIKSAVVRAIVEAPNSDVVMTRLFALGNKSWLVIRLVKWLDEAKEGREDLLFCASYMLAALARNDEHCVSLVHQYGVDGPLSKIVASKTAQQFGRSNGGSARPGEVTQILYGVVSLLRHLAIPVPNKTILGESDIIGPVSLLLQRELDVVGPLQNSVVGLLKHLTAANVANSLRVLEVEGVPGDSTSTPIDLLVALIPRTDDVRLRSEATRVLVNIVRTLFATKPLATTELAAASPITPTLTASAQSSLNAEETLKRRGRPKVVRREVVEALSEMVRLSEKYPMLINEAVVGLTLLAGSGGAGAIYVLEALLEPHAKVDPTSEQAASTGLVLPTSDSRDEAATHKSSSRTASLAISPAGDPPCSIDMLVNWLGLFSSGQLFPTAAPPQQGQQSLTNGLTMATPAATATAAAASSSSSSPPSNVKPEMVGNVCALIITVTRGSEVAKADFDKVNLFKSKLVGPLLGCLEVVDVNVKQQKEAQGGASLSNWEQLVKTIERCAQVVGAESNYKSVE
ncbi:hypothetical protein ACM66B_000062 [Microbotryomycetes sp. NB124-2]